MNVAYFLCNQADYTLHKINRAGTNSTRNVIIRGE